MRKFLVLGFMVLPLLVAGCSKGPAEAALKAADEAIAKAAPDAEKFVPDQFKAVTDAAAAAKADFDKGDYAAALAAAKDLPAKTAAVVAAATAKKDELTGLWKGLAETLPAQVAGLTEKINGLAAMKKLPKGLDKAKLDEVRTRLADMTATWTKAVQAFNGGDLKSALELGANVKTNADWLQTSYDAIMPAPKK